MPGRGFHNAANNGANGYWPGASRRPQAPFAGQAPYRHQVPRTIGVPAPAGPPPAPAPQQQAQAPPNGAHNAPGPSATRYVIFFLFLCVCHVSCFELDMKVHTGVRFHEIEKKSYNAFLPIYYHFDKRINESGNQISSFRKPSEPILTAQKNVRPIAFDNRDWSFNRFFSQDDDPNGSVMSYVISSYLKDYHIPIQISAYYTDEQNFTLLSYFLLLVSKGNNITLSKRFLKKSKW